MTASNIQHEIEVLKLKLQIKELEAELSRMNAMPLQTEEEERKERQSHSYPFADVVNRHSYGNTVLVYKGAIEPNTLISGDNKAGEEKKLPWPLSWLDCGSFRGHDASL